MRRVDWLVELELWYVDNKNKLSYAKNQYVMLELLLLKNGAYVSWTVHEGYSRRTIGHISMVQLNESREAV